VSVSALADKVIWITGASSGIGEALCHELAVHGAALVLSARREDVLKAVKSTCENSERHLVLPLDMLAPDTFAGAFTEVRDRFGKVDILINCAGISQRANAVDTDLKVDRQLMDLNYFAPITLTKLVLPSMLARGDGQIVVISSMMGKFALPARSAYSASKHALHGFFDALRAEVAGQGVSVTVVCPGYIRTNASFNALEGDGTRHNKLDSDIAGGLAPEKCAQQIVRAIERRRPEVYIARYEKLGLYISRFAPGLFRRIARAKAKRRNR
jgi:dehydrogenase/reductase SDR family member 7B